MIRTENSCEKAQKMALRSGKRLFKIVRFYLIFTIAFLVLYPLLYMLTMTFRQSADFIDPSVVWVPKNWSLDTLKLAFHILDYPISAGNSAILALCNTVLLMVSCGFAGYGFSRFEFRGKKLMFAFLLVSIVVPVQTVIIPMYTQLNYFDFFFLGQIGRIVTGHAFSVNLLNTFWATFIPSLFANGIRGGLYVYIFYQFFKGLPRDLEDAAYIDGAGSMRTYTHIIVPCASAPFLVVFVLSVIWYWNDTTVTNMFLANTKTLARIVDSLKENLYLKYDQFQIFQIQQAACLLLIVPVLIMYLFLQKFFIESIDKTGLK